jgi:hypothetical protein
MNHHRNPFFAAPRTSQLSRFVRERAAAAGKHLVEFGDRRARIRRMRPDRPITARKSAPASTSGPQFCCVMPPIA